MKIGRVFGIVLGSMLLMSNIWASTNSNFSAAKNVIQNWFSAMQSHQVDAAANYLSPQFVSIHTDGITRNKTQEITLIKNLRMQSHHLSNFKFSGSGNTIVVTYQDQGSEMIDNKKISSKSAGRMAVLQWQGNRWLIIAYANLDRIS